MYSLLRLTVYSALLSLSLSACGAGHLFQSESPVVSGEMRGINHTSSEINWFQVNGYGGPNVGRYGEGGGYCCVTLPRKWVPGIKMEVEWEEDPNPRTQLPPFGTKERDEAYARYKANYRRHKAVVDIPPYQVDEKGNPETCGITVHFLPCNQIKATTSCWSIKNPNYPLQLPRKMKEPAQCPR